MTRGEKIFGVFVLLIWLALIGGVANQLVLEANPAYRARIAARQAKKRAVEDHVYDSVYAAEMMKP